MAGANGVQKIIEGDLSVMVKQGIITEQMESTAWVSSLTDPIKAKGLRIC